MSAARIAASKVPLKIPKYIPRGPTDILKALSGTVKYDTIQIYPTFQDDPFLLPATNYERKEFLLTKLSGQKTARFILNKHPELFFRDESEPRIEYFQPDEQFDMNMEFTSDDIKWCIDNSDPQNAVIAYNWLKEKNIKLDDELLLQFYEFMCFTNEDSQSNYIESEMNKFLDSPEDKLVKYTWKPDGLAAKIFEEIKGKHDPTRVYSAMIASLSKYNQHASAKQTFENFKEKFPSKGLAPAAYNGLLYSASKLCSSIITATEAIDEIVNHMAVNLVKPNLITFNNILTIYRDYRGTKQEINENALKFLNDMKTLNIQPSLYTYSSIIHILVRRQYNYSKELRDILLHVEHNYDELMNIRDERDSEFLYTCSVVTTYGLNDLQLTKRLIGMYLKNPNMFQDYRQQGRFFSNIFKFLITVEPLEEIMKFYDKFIPEYFKPSLDAIEALTDALELYQADDETIFRIGQDLIKMKIAGYLKKDEIYRKDPKFVQGLNDLADRRGKK